MTSSTAARSARFRNDPPWDGPAGPLRPWHLDLNRARTILIPSISPDLALARATLRRGTRFLGADPRPPGSSKVIGNGLREVDRFLSILIDAVAAGLALDHVDRRRLLRQHNTARKLATVRTAMALASPDDAALRAIGRSRACLFHTGGIVRVGTPRRGRIQRPARCWAHPDAPSPGTLPSRPAGDHLPGDRLIVSARDLYRIGLFYDRVADDLIAAHDRQRGA